MYQCNAHVLGLAERIRRAVEAQPISTDAREISITVSLGAALSSGASPIDPEAMLRNADDALYRAKQGDAIA